MVYRIYVEKKPELAHEAKTLKNELAALLGIKGLEDVRIINRYDAENITKELQTIDVMALTPMDAINKLFLLREKARKL